MVRYGPFFGTDICVQEVNCQVVLAAGGTATNLRATSTDEPGTGKSWTFTLFKNGSAEANLSCTIADSATSCSDLTDGVTFVAGDRISIRITGSGNPPGNRMGSWSILFT